MGRTGALVRVFAAFYASFAEVVAGFALVFVGLPYLLATVLWQLLTGRSPSPDSRVGDAVERVLVWPIDLYVYSFTGRGGMRWLP